MKAFNKLSNDAKNLARQMAGAADGTEVSTIGDTKYTVWYRGHQKYGISANTVKNETVHELAAAGWLVVSRPGAWKATVKAKEVEFCPFCGGANISPVAGTQYGTDYVCQDCPNEWYIES